MTDKDPKDMTASELLRCLADNDDQSNCRVCHIFYISDECGGHACGDWKRDLADKIDAELAEARELSLHQGAELWAKANGWPDFKPSEGFGAWLDRCALMRPRYDNGDPVDMEDFGDPESDDFAWYTVSDSGDWTIYAHAISPDPIEGDISERVKRPAPEVLGADGLPIVVGETVWNTFSWHKGVVKELNAKALKVNGKSTAYVEWSNGRWSPCIRLDHLTHTPPDTQNAIDDDATMEPWFYCASYAIDLGDDPDRETTTRAMIADLLRRQRELDKRTGGDA